MASTVSPRNGQNAPATGPGVDPSTLKPFSITHIRRSQPGQVLIDVIGAKDETDAQQRAGERFPDSTVLRICRARAAEDAELARNQGLRPDENEDTARDEPTAAPNARFIRGRFRLARSDDEPLLKPLSD